MTVVTYSKLGVNVISLISTRKWIAYFFSLLLKSLKMEREREAPIDSFERGRDVIFSFI